MNDIIKNRKVFYGREGGSKGPAFREHDGNLAIASKQAGG